MFIREDIRNIAIIAHVDHGKTTLVDELLQQSHTFRENQKVEERVMDSNDLERERGITILSKNTAINYKNTKINIVDTPGHADFGGEVERVLMMVDSVILVVDAAEGPMPQTKFVTKKALELNLKPIVVINKIDKQASRAEEVIDEVFDLFLELGANDEQLDFPIVYASAKQGYAIMELEDEKVDMDPLFNVILDKVNPPQGEIDKPFQMLVTTIDYNEYVGRIAVGKIERGVVKKNATISVIDEENKIKNAKISSLFVYDGLNRVEVNEAKLGDIVAIAGIADINIGNTIADPSEPEALPFVSIDEPTLSMNFIVNNSPFAGQEGDYVTSRHLRARLFKETETNVSLKVEETDSADCFKVSGRGELHLSILIENMRREGYEFQVSRPSVIFHNDGDGILEPIEILTVDVPEAFAGVVIEKLGPRKAEMINMTSAVNGYTRLEFKVPARGLIGFRSEFLTDTKGNGIMNHIFLEYDKFKGEIPGRTRGSLIAFETGDAVAYGLFNAQERGRLFVKPGFRIYQGMIVGECSRAGDIEVNVCKKKHLTNTRSSGADDALKLVSALEYSLEQCLEFIADDELVEVTPENIRMRKRLLDPNERKRAISRKK